ncbi:hypothetical protein FRC11_000391 [Ceratobasidium sp. 423]|nr:hypothetical protein FRC11_000391 [Ceratobasidium sp. 423]
MLSTQHLLSSLSSPIMPRHQVSQNTLSPGCAIMIMGCMSLIESDLPGDSSDDLGIFLLTLGLDIYNAQQQSGTRYGPWGKYRANRAKLIIDDLLGLGTSDREFKMWLRINRSSFFQLLDLIKDGPVFHLTGQKPQMPVKYQLAAFLARHGRDPAMKIKTPSRKEQRKLKQYAQDEGFPGAIDAVDGTPLDLKLQKNSVAFRTRKKTWGLNMQAVVDWDGKFISYDLGWPGCMPDVTMWKESHLWLHRDSYLSPDEWLIGDQAYPLTIFLITMFRDGQWDAPGNA